MVKKIEALREEWHQLEAFFSAEDGLEPASIDGVPIIVPGKLREVPVIVVPASATPELMDRISKAVVEAGCGEPIVLTSNVSLLRMKRITEREAKALMRDLKEKLDKIREGQAAAEAAAPPVVGPSA